MDPSTTTGRLEILQNFVGFGDPAATVWFVGLEEAGTWSCDWQKDEVRYRRYAAGHFFFGAEEIRADSKEHGRRYTKVYDIMSKILVLTQPVVRARGLFDADWRKYRDDYLLQEGNKDAFQTNLDPFGKSKLTEPWPTWYSTLFGIDQKTWLSEGRQTRDVRICRVWNQTKPQMTICFGSGSGSRFESVFGVRARPWRPLPVHDAFMAFVHEDQDRLLLVTPFFASYRMSNRRIGELAGILRGRAIE